ncbi:MAG TPA: DinB family protein [Roseiflexaceae bacterium]|nr:DinB family protein [Roseiflexaceae bacterium]
MTRRQILIESMRSTLRDLARLLRPVSAGQALWRPAPDAWCIAEVVAHLAYVEPRYLARLRRVVAEDTPAVEYIDDPGGHDLARPLDEHLQEFVARREETVAFLRGLRQADWGRRLVHPVYGLGRLRDHVQIFVAHDNEHLEQIVQLREQLDIHPIPQGEDAALS